MVRIWTISPWLSWFPDNHIILEGSENFSRRKWTHWGGPLRVSCLWPLPSLFPLSGHQEVLTSLSTHPSTTMTTQMQEVKHNAELSEIVIQTNALT